MYSDSLLGMMIDGVSMETNMFNIVEGVLSDECFDELANKLGVPELLFFKAKEVSFWILHDGDGIDDFGGIGIGL